MPDHQTSVSFEVPEKNPVKERILGTAYFLAPEVIMKKANQDCRLDIWSLGICYFQMLTGVTPFSSSDSTVDSLFDKICRGEIEWESEDELVFGPDGQDFVLKCLIKNHTERPFANDLKSCPIFAQTDFEILLQSIYNSADSQQH